MKNYENLTDNELTKLATTDSSACDFLLRKYSPLVKQIARSFFLIGAELDDLIQEGMLGLYKAVNTYEEDKSSFKTFCTTCIKNSIFDAIKSANTKKNSPLNTSVSIHQPVDDDESTFLLDIFTIGIDSAEIISQNEDYKSLVDFINTNFSELELSVLKMFLDGVSYQEISKKLSITTKKVDNTIQKIRKKLQNNLKNS